jgi:antitoxin (DNA-binding transcriptional repressor) of toxin-antitoxin stability system
MGRRRDEEIRRRRRQLLTIVDSRRRLLLACLQAAPVESGFFATRPLLGQLPSRKRIVLMRRVNIRDLNGKFFEAAAEADPDEPIGVTNNQQLCAVLLPVTEAWIDQVIVDNLSRLRNNIATAAKDSGAPIGLDDAIEKESGKSTSPFTRRVQIRELSGTLIREAAEKGERLGVMNRGRLAAVLVPVTPGWIDQLIDHSISRIAYSIEQAEKQTAAGTEHTSLDEITGTPRHRLETA